MAGENEGITSPQTDAPAPNELEDDDRGSSASPASAGTASGAAPSVPGAPAAPAAGAGGAPPSATNGAPPAPPAAPLSARAWAAQQFGDQNATQYADDAAYLQSLIAGQQTYRQQQQRMRELEAERVAWLQRAGQPATPPPAAPDPLAIYKGPEYDPRWLSMVQQDAQGNIIAKPGMDPLVVPKLQAALQHRQTIMEKLADNPAEFLAPLVEARARTLVQQEIQQQFQQHEEQNMARRFFEQNSAWMIARDSAGNMVRNPQTGKHLATPEGERFLLYLNKAQQIGVPLVAQEEYARALLTRDLALPHLQQAQGAQSGTQAREQIINDLNRRPSQSGSTVGATNGNVGAEQNSSLSIYDRLRQGFEAAGKDVIAAELAGDDR